MVDNKNCGFKAVSHPMVLVTPVSLGDFYREVPSILACPSFFENDVLPLCFYISSRLRIEKCQNSRCNKSAVANYMQIPHFFK